MLERDEKGVLVTDEETGKEKTRAVDMAASSQSGGRLVAKGDDAHYCFTPMLRFSNRVDDGKWDSEFYALEAVTHTIPETVNAQGVKEKEKEEFPVALVMWRVIGQGEFQCNFNLERFPFDEQTLVIKLLSGARPRARVLGGAGQLILMRCGACVHRCTCRLGRARRGAGAKHESGVPLAHPRGAWLGTLANPCASIFVHAHRTVTNVMHAYARARTHTHARARARTHTHTHRARSCSSTSTSCRRCCT
jgi:hypothetical protein